MFQKLPRILRLNGHSQLRCAANQKLGIAVSQIKQNIYRDYHCPVLSMIQPIDHLNNSRLNKGLAFTWEERQMLRIHGLLPPVIKTQEEQLEHCLISINRYPDPLDKYIFLCDIQDRNERLFYRLITENIETMMPIIYTPTVGYACQKFGLIFRKPRGLFITIKDRGHVVNVLRSWPEADVRAILVTDGERILGLGDLGANGMGVSIGKLALYTALAGVSPHECLPISLDVGTNNKALLDDPLYVGLRQPRVTGAEYDEFIDEFMAAVVQRFGQNTLIQFEDFANHNAFRFLDKYQYTHCTYNDDIQGSAAVAVAGLYASSRLTGKTIADHKILFVGAGEAAIGIAELCCKAMAVDGIPLTEARQKIWMSDIDGLLVTNRKEGDLNGPKKFYAKDHKPMKNLREIVQDIKPSVLIGASATAGLFTPEILKDMASFNDRPIIFAFSNPTSKAECTAEQAFNNTEGRVIFSSGSPFPPVNYNGKTFKTGQANNAYIFPGVSFGVMAVGMHHVPDDVFLIAAREVAALVSDEDLENGSLYPTLKNILEISLRISTGIANYAYCRGLATEYPEPKDKRKWLEGQRYNYYYTSSMPVTWSWNTSKPRQI